jgi:enoyl-CoA hydratase/carnithine racemase
MPVVLYEKKGRIAYVTLNRPEALNAYNREVLLESERIWLDFNDDPEIWVGIFTGAGEKAFCAGADLKAIASIGGFELYRGPNGELIHSLQTDLDLKKPVIAAINGHCLAGGMDMALSCDIRIASENATFGLTMVKRSLTPGANIAWFIHQVPLGIAMEMAYSGDSIDAQEAYRIGLVNKVVPLKDLLPTATELAERICQNGPLAVHEGKHYQGTEFAFGSSKACSSAAL